MLILVSLLILALCLAKLRCLTFENFFVVLLATPALALPLGIYVGSLPAVLYILVCALLVVIISRAAPRTSAHFPRDSVAALLVFAVSLFIFHELCLSWPDFVSMGERLRDYAILAAVIHDPIHPAEPWMAGEPLRYYLYWYRFGQFLATVGHLEVWETYHVLVSFAFAFFAAAVFRLLSSYLNFSRRAALVLTAVIVLGSNLRGVFFFLLKEGQWWDPSRVIKGAINEFPAWSFLLGDAHPHYLNLASIAFCLCILMSFLQKPRSYTAWALLLISLIAVIPLWISNANAWEVPMWAAVLGAFALAGLIRVLLTRSWPHLKSIKTCLLRIWDHDSRFSLIAVLLLQAWGVLALLWASSSIPQADHQLRWVSAPIPRTTLGEIALHWGIPLFLIALGQLVTIRSREGKVGFVAVLAVTAASGQAWPVLCLLLAVSLWQILLAIRDSIASGSSDSKVDLGKILGITALGLILIPEFLFLDDPYGGDNERMNTIFKIYSCSWFMLHTYAFSILREAYIKLRGPLPVPLLPLFAALVLMCGFFVHTIGLRRSNNFSVLPIAQGLSQLSERFPGSAEAIKRLQKLPFGIVLEAQGPAYDNTSHVATLSAQQSYLGWANHAGLLTKKYDEVRRREEVTRQVYQEQNCEPNLQRLKAERIDYVVLGPLEKRWEPSANRSGFECLLSLVQAGEYEIFRVPG